MSDTLPWNVRRVAVATSTNDELLADATMGDRSALVADHQTAGRPPRPSLGVTPGANLLVSLKLVPGTATGGAAAIPRRVAVAASDAIDILGTGAASLKWPNDVLLDGVKVAGLLAQGGSTGEVVVGIGINVGWAPEGGARLGSSTTPGELLDALLAAYDALPVDAAAFHERYRARLATLGQQVRIELTGDSAPPIVGVAVDVMDDGRLVVDTDGGARHHVSVGDVHHLRPT